jgi:hypothetical protein
MSSAYAGFTPCPKKRFLLLTMNRYERLRRLYAAPFCLGHDQLTLDHAFSFYWGTIGAGSGGEDTKGHGGGFDLGPGQIDPPGHGSDMGIVFVRHHCPVGQMAGQAMVALRRQLVRGPGQ